MRVAGPLFLVSLFALGACELDPFCVDCVDASTDSMPPDADAIVRDAFPEMQMDAMPETGPMCGDLSCGVGERCDQGPPAMCVPNTCADLACAVTELCMPAPDGSGNICVDNSCSDAVDCALEQHCGPGGFCIDDVCVPATSMCSANGVSICAPDGSGFSIAYTCGSDAYFTSSCTPAGDEAFCPCTDDWDCPANTECIVDRCVGTGREPTCTLPPAPFSDVLPQPEAGFPWGGVDEVNSAAVGSPFPTSSQAVITPLVANLNDDNGDGVINENDVPEIIFMSFCGRSFTTNGTLRAIHGGAPAPGGDFFASCGTNLWNEGDDINTGECCTDGVLDPTSTPAVGDINGDGIPEIVAIDETDRLRLYSNTGVELARSPSGVGSGNQAVAIANFDGQGFAEVAVGEYIWSLELDANNVWSFVNVWKGDLGRGRNGQGPISCIADITGDGVAELIGGSTAYQFPAAPAGITRQADCTGGEAGDAAVWCSGDLNVLWDASTVNSAANREGFCAVADVWGADQANPPGPTNRLDGVPELVLVTLGRVQIFDTRDGSMILNQDVVGARGGAPNVDDFDGDGFPEIGTAGSTGYELLDLQPATAACPQWPTTLTNDTPGPQTNPPRMVPAAACTAAADCGDPTQFTCDPEGQCVCLHNSWIRQTEDSSSQVTGSSVFDFNGDGAAEVVYNDECFFRVYDGVTGEVLFKEPSPSRTRTENPIVADVDSDGNAEIVFAASNESGFCSGDNNLNNGIEVWGDASDSWVNARRIYNQHAYHVTNVYEGGGIPPRSPESWQPWNGRLYNTYRSQPRAPFGAAPDLQVASVQISSPDAACGMLTQTIDITARIRNGGDVLVGAQTPVTFFGIWNNPALDEALLDGGGVPLTTTIGVPLSPGAETLVTVRYMATANTPGVIPNQVRVVVDGDNNERECIEDNNEQTVDVAGGELVADLEVDIGLVNVEMCPTARVETTITNNGSAPASDVLVVYYAGDPSAGVEIHRETRPGPIAPGNADTFTASIADFSSNPVIVHVVVDPEDAIPECNDGNNSDAADQPADCGTII